MSWSPEQLDGYIRFYFGAIALLEQLRIAGSRYKTVHRFHFAPTYGGACWRGLDDHCGDITIFRGCEPGAVAHELGHGFHESIRGGRDEFGEDYAEAIRWFTEQQIGPSSWCKRFESESGHRAILDACNFDWKTFVCRIQSGIIFPNT
jgi:hypothetical protein